jgi:hypothetical protein
VRLGLAKLTVVRWEHGRARPSPGNWRLLLQLEANGSPGEESTRPSSPVSCAGLPVALTSFVGRECELAQLTALLDEARLLTLTGTGGCGKTRLALRLSEAVRARFPDGTGYVDLAPLPAPSVCARR